MSYNLILDNDGTDPQLASNDGWEELCDWAEEFGDIEIEYFCQNNETGDAKALKAELKETLASGQTMPETVRSTLKSLMKNLKDANTAYVSDGLS